MPRISRTRILMAVAVGLSLVVAGQARALELPKTGQTRCFSSDGSQDVTCAGSGQDGEIQAGAAWPAPRFEDNGDATVTDWLTGLVWTREANVPGPPACNPGTGKSWGQAVAYVTCLNNNNYLNRNDWRIPNANEMGSLFNANGSGEWLTDQGFLGVDDTHNYWTSTPAAGDTSLTWIFGMWSGGMGGIYRDGGLARVWPVSGSTINLPRTGVTKCYNLTGGERSCAGSGQDGESQTGQSWSEPRFQDNGDGTVTDWLTGLMWNRALNTPAFATCTGGVKTWPEALGYVACLNRNNYHGHSDWRLPNKRELGSLADYSRNSPALPAGHPFSDEKTNLWSSTTFYGNTNDSWILDLGHGGIQSSSKGTLLDVLPVRNGQLCAQPPADLVSWWPAEGSGADLMGVNSLAVSGGAGFGPGRVGQALDLDGVAGYAEKINPSLPAGGSPFTVTMWFRPGRVNFAADQSILNFGTEAANQMVAFGLPANSDKLRFEWWDGAGVVESSTSLAAGAWYFIAATYDGTAVRLYVNGTLEDETPFAESNLGGAVLRLGRTASGQFAQGLIDEVLVAVRALELSEVQGLYEAGGSGLCSTANLSASMTDSPDPVARSGQITYTITVTNNGPRIADEVVLTDPLPGNLAYVSAATSKGVCNQAAGLVTCGLGNMLAGSSEVVTIVATAPDVSALISNGATITSASNDPNSLDNYPAATTSVAPRAFVVSLTPSEITSEAGRAQTFAAVYRGTDGIDNLQTVDLRVGPADGGANAIWVRYNRKANKIYLADDAGVFSGTNSCRPGRLVNLHNSQGSVSCKLTTVAGAGNKLTVNWRITPKMAFANGVPKELMMIARHNTGRGSGWVDQGNWTVLAANTAPVLGDLEPAAVSSAVGTERTFAAVYSDPDGQANLKAVDFQVRTAGSGNANAIWVRYDRNAQRLYLADNAGAMPVSGGCALGAAGRLENGQGSIDCLATTAAGLGNNLTVNWKITPKAAFAGGPARKLRMMAVDNSGATSGWAVKGSWAISPQ